MNDSIEQLLQSYEGPEPSPEVRRSLMAVARAQAHVNAHEAARKARRRRNARWMCLAAMLAVSAVAAVVLWPNQPTRGPAQAQAVAALGAVECDDLPVERDGRSLTLGRGSQLYAADRLAPAKRSDVRLSDGSLVRIDGGAKLFLTAPDATQRALLELEAGRIFLRVSDAAGEFIVSAGARVSVVGTAFGVSRQAGTTAVDVIEGKVIFESDGAKIELERGQSGAAREGGPPALAGADPNAELRWARDAIQFHNRPLGEVLDWISRNSSYRFTAAPAVREIRVSVTIDDKPMLDSIDAMMLACGLLHDVRGNDITISN